MKSTVKIFAFLFALVFAMSAHAGIQLQNLSAGKVQPVGVAGVLQCEGGLSCAKQAGGKYYRIGLSQIPYTSAGITRFTSQWTTPTLTGGTSTAGVVGTMFLTQIHIVHSAILTGVQLLNNTPCGTDKWQVALYDYAGNRLAQSATAGVTCSGTSVYQLLPFTAPYTATYPGTYWIGLASNGTTDHFESVPAVGAIGGLAGSVTGQTFGALSASITLPTTFTADKGPIAGTY